MLLSFAVFQIFGYGFFVGVHVLNFLIQSSLSSFPLLWSTFGVKTKIYLPDPRS